MVEENTTMNFKSCNVDGNTMTKQVNATTGSSWTDVMAERDNGIKGPLELEIITPDSVHMTTESSTSKTNSELENAIRNDTLTKEDQSIPGTDIPHEKTTVPGGFMLDRNEKPEETTDTYVDIWEPYRYFYEDGVCLVFAKPGILDRDDLECCALTDPREINHCIRQPSEKQLSSLLQITYIKSAEVKLKEPVRIFLPCTQSYRDRKPVIKIQVLGETSWEYHTPLSCKSDHEEPNITSFGVTMTRFHSFKMLIVGEPTYTTVTIPPKGLSIADNIGVVHLPENDEDTLVHLTTPVCPNCDLQDVRTGSKSNFRFKWATILLDLRLENQIKSPVEVHINQTLHNVVGNGIGSFQFALTRSLEFITRNMNLSAELLKKMEFRGILTGEELLVIDVCDSLEHKIEALINLLKTKATFKDCILKCFRETNNRVIVDEIENKTKLYPEVSGARTNFVGRTDNDVWFLLKPGARNENNRHLTVTLPAKAKHYLLAGVSMGREATNDEIIRAAADVYNLSYASKMTLFVGQKSRNPLDMYITCFPSDESNQELKKVIDKGYNECLNVKVEFPMNVGDVLEIDFRSNIGLDSGRFRIHKHKMCFEYCQMCNMIQLGGNLYVVDSAMQSLEKTYSGQLTYAVKINDGRNSEETRLSGYCNVYLEKEKDNSPSVCLAADADLQALIVFIAQRMEKDLSDKDSLYYMLDTFSNVIAILSRVSIHCSNYPESSDCELFLHIWAHEQQTEKTKKIKKLLHAVEQFGWMSEAERFLKIYLPGGLLSDASLLKMAKLIGRDWQDIAVKLSGEMLDGVPSDSVSQGNELSAKVKTLDRFRLSDRAISYGLSLPKEFRKMLNECRSTKRILKYIR